MVTELDNREKRETFAQDLDLRRRQEREEQARGSTFLAHTHIDDLGGRFATVHETTIIGGSPVPTYPRPPSGPWSGPDPVPNEQPIGHSVDEMVPLETSAGAVEATGDPAVSDPLPKGCDPLPDAVDVERDVGSPFSSGEDD
jgi:hypothetical protein